MKTVKVFHVLMDSEVNIETCENIMHELQERYHDIIVGIEFHASKPLEPRQDDNEI